MNSNQNFNLTLQSDVERSWIDRMGSMGSTDTPLDTIATNHSLQLSLKADKSDPPARRRKKYIYQVALLLQRKPEVEKL